MINNNGGGTGLRGSPFMLFQAWMTLINNPGLDVWAQANTARNIWIIIKPQLTDDLKKKLLESDTTYKELFEEFDHFSQVTGTIEEEAAFWDKVSQLLADLMQITNESRLIDNSSMQDLMAPRKLNG